MTARHDYPLRRHGSVPPHGVIIERHVYNAMADEVDKLREQKARLRAELAKHGWGDMHYGVQPQEPAIVRLLEETR